MKFKFNQRKCGEKAGFRIQRIVSNPMASCLAYNLEDDNSNER
jgi:molecular chaperone DnaK (HSP70)